MSQFRPGEVWSEREDGDWEACVATAYAMALLYGGVIMPAPYTQAERERLEVRADEPQDLNATDARALEVYGAKLRPASVTSSLSAFLGRPGMGFTATGTGSPIYDPAGTYTHEVMMVGKTATTLTVYDPLAPPGAAPVDRSVSQMAVWATHGLGPNDVREIRQGELAGEEMNPNTQIPIATGRAFGPASVYANEDRSLKLFDMDSGEDMDPVGVYAWPANETDSAGKVSLAPIRVDLIGAGGEDLRVGYIGIDRLTLHEPEPPEPAPPAEDYQAGYEAASQAWADWLSQRPTSPAEDWLEQAPTEP
jgi:hypothetical protein